MGMPVRLGLTHSKTQKMDRRRRVFVDDITGSDGWLIDNTIHMVIVIVCGDYQGSLIIVEVEI